MASYESRKLHAIADSYKGIIIYFPGPCPITGEAPPIPEGKYEISNLLHYIADMVE